MKFTNIKKILRKQVDNEVRVLWTYDEENLTFTQIYQLYNNKLSIYTPLQLLNKLQDA